MNRVPPNLLYLTIYNPTLRPSGPVDDDNEDAEEQAHIVFYTSKERAVSRDRMLRQIGLAKALVNFAELFNAHDQCNNVHSQSKRMIMVSPEPNFWIHAGIEVAKVPKEVDLKGKSKAKTKESAPQPLYDHEEGSVLDGALRARILKGYERFKLTHGSFTSILANLGQQALELQLERFWTVWSWSWDMEKSPDFGEEFGPQLHPHLSSLSPLIDDFADDLSSMTTLAVISRSHVIPSNRFSERRYPPSLVAHLASIIPPWLEPSASSDTVNTLASSVDTIRARIPQGPKAPSSSQPGGTFLGMPAMNVNMDMRKWNWGVLTFGKGATAKPSAQTATSLSEKSKEKTLADVNPPLEVAHTEVEVNTDDLQDAISSDANSVRSESRASPESRDVPPITGEASPVEGHPLVVFADPNPDQHEVRALSTGSIPTTIPVEETPPPSPPPLPEFSTTRVHLAPSRDSVATRRVSVHYLIRKDLMIALIDEQEAAEDIPTANNIDLQYASENALELFDSIQMAANEATLKDGSESLPSATKILQSQDRYLMSMGQYTFGSPGFSTVSNHLFNAKAILDAFVTNSLYYLSESNPLTRKSSDREITEVFSRGQNPQHWHIAKRGVGGVNPSLGVAGIDEEVFMEVFRKETTLTDVDNVLAGVVKKFGSVEGGSISR